MENNGQINVDLQDQVERQVHGEDERQAIRMQEMMQQMQREVRELQQEQ